MNSQVFIQSAVVFVVSITCTNVLINFIRLGIEAVKKCSIMNGERQEKIRFPAGKKTKYAVLKAADKIA